MATYWLATDGSDTNPGTREAPFRTWKYAVSQLTSDGDELVVRPGTYQHGTAGAMMPERPEYKQWVTIRAEVPGTVRVWYGSQYVLLPIRPFTRVQGIWFSGGTGIRWADNSGPKHDVLIEDCEFKSTDESMAATGRRCGRPLDLAGGRNITLRRCLFEKCVIGPTVGTGSDPIANVLIEDCVSRYNRSDTNLNVDGFLVDEPRDAVTCTYTDDHNVVLRRCTAIGHGDAGFDIKPVALLEDCVATENGYVGFKLWGIGTRLVRCLGERNDDAGASMANNHQLADRCTFAGNGRYSVRPQGLEGQRITRSILVGPMHNANSDTQSVVVTDSLFWVPGEDPKRWALTGKHTSYSQVVWTWEEVVRGECPAIGSGVILAPPGEAQVPGTWGHTGFDLPVPGADGPQGPPAGGDVTVTLSAEEVEALRVLQRVLQRIEGGH